MSSKLNSILKLRTRRSSRLLCLFAVFTFSPLVMPAFLIAEPPIELVHLEFRQGRVAVGHTDSQDSSLYMIDFSSLEISPLVDRPGKHANPRWSNDGKRVAYDSVAGGKSGIFVKSLVEPYLAQTPLIELDGAQEPDWSPDDAYLVFSARNKSDSGRSLFIVNVLDSQFRRLHSAKDSVTFPRWSPRGTEIVFSSNHSWPGWDLMVLDLNSRQVQTVSKGVQNYVRPAWHPNGGAFVFSYGSAREFDLWTIEKGGSESKELLALPGREFDAEWILNGRVLLFVAEDTPGSGRYELFMYDFPSKQLSQITKSRGSIRGISWTPFPVPPEKLPENGNTKSGVANPQSTSKSGQ